MTDPTPPEPYINKKSGEIRWATSLADLHRIDSDDRWILYADFEREKLRELGAYMMLKGGGYQVVHLKNMKRKFHTSNELIGYSYDDYRMDSESNRLLKRAEFLKAVCEKEGVEWLPKETPPEQCDECENSHYNERLLFCKKCRKQSPMLDALWAKKWRAKKEKELEKEYKAFKKGFQNGFHCQDCECDCH